MAAGNTSAPARPLIAHPIDIGGQSRLLYNETVAWFSDNSLRIVVAVAIAAGIVAVLLGVQKLARRYGRENEELVDWRAILGRIAERTSFWFLVIVAARLVDGYADAPKLVDRTIEYFFTVALTFQAAMWARELVLGFVERRAGVSDQDNSTLGSAITLIRFFVTFSLFSLAVVLVLGNLGVNVTGLVAGLGVGGIAIGLAAQGIFADLFAALAIIFDKPFRRGDAISYGESTGTVEAIGMKSTRIRAYTGELRIIANKLLLDKEVLNVTQRDYTRISFMIGIAYETPPDTLARLPDMLREMVTAEGASPARAGFEAFGASSLDFALLFDVPGNDWTIAHATRDRLMVAIIRRFAEEKIVIPYPTQTTYTAAPDGRLVMPYAESPPARPASGVPA
ncbi:MAG TPA: mechanosensitive ion channel family protein [Sphingomonas sp.]